MQREERDADEQGDEYPSLLVLLADQEHCASQRELTQHLDRLPQESRPLVVAGQELGCLPQTRSLSVQNCITARPKQRGVKQRHANGPEHDEEERGGVRQLVLIRLTGEGEVLAQVAAGVPFCVVKPIAQKGLEDGGRRAWYEEERHHQYQRESPLRPFARERGDVAGLRMAPAKLKAVLHPLLADTADDGEQHDGDRPQRLDQ
mmetsp:Transcript_22372/g.53709  ORF Transcript_22372/g.53709 Transcript_22372/m.53709 type:complete len:204 (-) Transcript_22372:1828-2439(-)